jgi:hypothetical protein
VVVLSVYRVSHVCGNICIVVALCLSWLEYAEPVRTVMRVVE